MPVLSRRTALLLGASVPVTPGLALAADARKQFKITTQTLAATLEEVSRLLGAYTAAILASGFSTLTRL